MNNFPSSPFSPLPSSSSTHHDPSVSLLLSALSWLTSRKPHDLAVRSAIARHLYLLVRHPASDGTDIEAGFSMVNQAGLDACLLLSRVKGGAARMH